jgi:hypothetical protein
MSPRGLQNIVLSALLSSLITASCGLNFNESDVRKTQNGTECRESSKPFPGSKLWTSELLTALLNCASQSPLQTTTAKNQHLKKTAQWLNNHFDIKTKDSLILFLDSIPTEIGPLLKKFAQIASSENQRHWPEWIIWTQAIVGAETKVRPELLAEQLKILALAPPDSIQALVKFLNQVRRATPENRTKILERLNKVYQDFSENDHLKSFLIKAITPLQCLRFEADRKDTSLISSGWSLLIDTRDDPIMFGRTFVQSYGLLQSFCQTNEVPTNTETQAALKYFVQHYSQVFAPILGITDSTTRSLIPLIQHWSESELSFTQAEFRDLIDTAAKFMNLAHQAEEEAFSTFFEVLSMWSKEQSEQEILQSLNQFKRVKWKNFVVPRDVIDEWSLGSHNNKFPFFNMLAGFVDQGSHHRMAELLRHIKIRKNAERHLKNTHKSPFEVAKQGSIYSRIKDFEVRTKPTPLPAEAYFLECLNSPETFELWDCLKEKSEPIPYSRVLMQQEAESPLFFLLRDSEQPGRWLGQGFFSASSLSRWNSGMNTLRGLNLPISHFVRTFPFNSLSDDKKISDLYNWLRSSPQTQPETSTLRSELGIPKRLEPDDFDHRQWLEWFNDPTKWSDVQKILAHPTQGPLINHGLKDLVKKTIRVRLYRSDLPGLHLTSASTLGMLSALDILLWEAPYNWTREWIIAEILSARTPADLAKVLRDSKSKLQIAYDTLNSNRITRHGKLWKKTHNALTILDATIALRIERELFNWSEVMKALAGSMDKDQATKFLVLLQKTGIISSISHFLHDQNPTSSNFASTLIEVFHMIRSSKANSQAWFSAVIENQKSHGLFVYQILALCSFALEEPDRHIHLKHMNAFVRTGSHWIAKEKRMIPFKLAFDTITGPESVFNPWIWIFLREIQDPRSKSHDPWMRILASLETSAGREDIRAWLETGIPENIGSWMDAIILTPSTRF